MAYLADKNEQRFSLNCDSTTIGRHPDCDIVLDEGAVSRMHSRIIRDESGYSVQDLQTRNGTFVNNEQVGDEPHVLQDGDRLRLCDIVFTLHLKDTVNEDTETLRTVDFDELPVDATIGARQTAFGQITSTDQFSIEDDPDPLDLRSEIVGAEKVDKSSLLGQQQLAHVQLAALLEMTQHLGASLAISEVTSAALETLFAVFPQCQCGFVVLAASDGSLVPHACKTQEGDNRKPMCISRDIVTYVMDARDVILLTRCVSDNAFEDSQSQTEFKIRTIMCGPLLDTDGTSLGVILLDTGNVLKPFCQQDLTTLACASIPAGLALDRAQHHARIVNHRQSDTGAG